MELTGEPVLVELAKLFNALNSGEGNPSRAIFSDFFGDFAGRKSRELIRSLKNAFDRKLA